MEDFKIYDHNPRHHLSFRRLKDGLRCYICDSNIYPSFGYGCKRCNIWLDESCLEKELPPAIIHPLHPQHRLSLHTDVKYFECDACCRIFESCPRYECKHCKFKVDMRCAPSLIEHHKSLGSDSELTEREKKAIRIRSHVHPVEILDIEYGMLRAEKSVCKFCDHPLSGMCYGCWHCKFYIHQHCSDKMPKRLQHPFHPYHGPLHLRYTHPKHDCNACGNICQLLEPCYCCGACDFSLHYRCASLTPTFKHGCHPHHPLTYMNRELFGFYCNKCGDRGGTTGSSYYRCVQCDFSIHLSCIPLPTTTNCKYHLHSLTFTKRVIEDDYGKYYCDVCEDERNPLHNVYCCEECKFVAHIECALPQEVEGTLANTSGYMDRKALQDEQRNAESWTTQMQHSLHKHPLVSFSEMPAQYDGLYCKFCDLRLSSGPVYGCTTYEACEYYIHKVCGELPHEIMSHPLHPQHPLVVFPTYPGNMDNGLFMCDECEDISKAFVYYCVDCDFKLDIKCAASVTAPRNHDKRLEEMETWKRLSLLHFAHNCESKLFSYHIWDDNERSFEFHCNGCWLPVTGPAIGCLACKFFLHESCYLALPREIQCPLHPFHSVQCLFLQETRSEWCYACGLVFDSENEDKADYICYGCHDNDSGNRFLFHFACVKSLGRPLTLDNFHQHDLYYWGSDSHMVFKHHKYSSSSSSFKCKICSKLCEDAFYRCVECRINFHLECIPIPQAIRSRCHIHPLTLKESFVEDDSGEYYCDVCEEERNGKHHVYYCDQECSGLFVAHIECVLHKVEEIISFSPIPEGSSSSDEDY